MLNVYVTLKPHRHHLAFPLNFLLISLLPNNFQKKSKIHKPKIQIIMCIEIFF